MQLLVKDRTFYKSVWQIATPVIMQSLITAGVNMMDTLMLTSCGEISLSASSLANQFVSLFQIMCMGIGVGAAVLTAQFWGKKDLQGIRRVVTLMLRVCIVTSVLFTMAALSVPAKIMRIYTPDTATILEGEKYLRIIAFTLLLNGLSLTITAVLRSVRQVRLPLYTSILAFFVNVFFNWVLIFGHLGAPALRIEGAAYGTLIARIVECIVIAGYFLIFDQRISYRPICFLEPCQGYFALYARYCIPVLVSDTLLGLGNNMISVVMGHIGVSFVSAFAVVSQLTRMTTVFTQGLSSAASVITGNTIGSGERQKAFSQGVTFFIMAICVGCIASGIVFLISPWITNGSHLRPETMQIAKQLFYSVNITVIFGSIQSVLTKGVLRGGGDTKFLMLADILFLWAASVPLGYLTGIVWKYSAFWVYLALHADWMIKSVWCAIRLFRGEWMHETHHTMESYKEP